MSNILNLVKLDYYTLKSSSLGRLAVVGLVPLLAGIIGKNPPLILGFSMMLAGFFMSTVFATAEKSNLNKLYGILPVEKRQTVIGRYLLALCAGIAVAGLASVLVFVAAFVQKVELSSFIFGVWLSASFLLFCFVVAAQFPLYFKYEFSKLAAFANLPYILLILAASYLIKRDPQIFGRTVNFFLRNHYMVWLIGIGSGLILVAVSCLLAVKLYQNREL